MKALIIPRDIAPIINQIKLSLSNKNNPIMIETDVIIATY